MLLTPLLASDDINDILSVQGDNTDGANYIVQYEQIFPFLYMDEAQTNVKAYICFDVDIPSIPSYNIKDMKIIIRCLCHRDYMEFSKSGYLGTRADILADAVERTIRNFQSSTTENNTQQFGIGELSLDSVLEISSENKIFYGKELIFTVSDFMLKAR